MLVHSVIQNKKVIDKAGAKGKVSTLVKVIKLQYGWQKTMVGCAGDRVFPRHLAPDGVSHGCMNTARQEGKHKGSEAY